MIQAPRTQQGTNETQAPVLQNVEPGQSVRIRSLQQVGEVLTPPDSGGQVLVQAGVLKLTVPLSDLERVEEPAEKAKTGGKRIEETSTDYWVKGGWGDVSRRTTMNVSPELHLRGMYVEESLERLDKFLDEAVLANLNRVRVIHGKGTGTLRRAVHDWLRADPVFDISKLQTAPRVVLGVTVVELFSRCNQQAAVNVNSVQIDAQTRNGFRRCRFAARAVARVRAHPACRADPEKFQE